MVRRLRELLRAVYRSTYFYPAVAVVTGAVGAVATLSIDTMVEFPWLPWVPRPGPSAAQALLGGIAGGMITATAVVFWVRGMIVQLAAGQFSSRVLQPYLHNPFERALMSFIIGTFVFSVIALLSVPESGEGATAPMLSLLTAALLATTALLAIVAVIARTARATRIEEVVRAVTDSTIAAVRRMHPPPGSAPTPEQVANTLPAEPGCLVRADDSGWVHHVDGDALLEALPDGGAARLEVRVGHFLASDMALCTVWPEPDDLATLQRRVRAAVVIRRHRMGGAEVELGIRELVDAASAALAVGSADTTAGYETIVHLGAVLGEVLVRDLPQTAWCDDRDRRVLQPWGWSYEDYVNLTFGDIRTEYANNKGTALNLLRTFGNLARDRRIGPYEAAVAPLRRQAALVVAGYEASQPLPEDFHDVRRTAAEYGFVDTVGARA